MSIVSAIVVLGLAATSAGLGAALLSANADRRALTDENTRLRAQCGRLKDDESKRRLRTLRRNTEDDDALGTDASPTR